MVEFGEDARYETEHSRRMRVLGGRSNDEIDIPRYT